MTSAARYRWGGRWPVLVGVAIYAALSAAFMLPALTDCGHVLMGQQPGDATGGGVWQAWNYHTLSPFATTTPLVGGPTPGDLWKPEAITSLGWILPYSVLAKFADPVCTWNIAMWGGFVADGIAMLLFIRWLTGDARIAFVAGYAYAFSPYHIEKSYAHIGYLYTWIFPVLLWSLIAFFRSPTWRRAGLCGVALAVAGYTDGYFLLLAPAMVVTVLVVGLISKRRSRWNGAHWRGAATMLAVATVLMAPILAIRVVAGSRIDDLLARGVDDLRIFSARPTDYLLPSHTHPIFGSAVSEYAGHRLHGSGYSEQTLYIGTVVLVSALVFVILALRNRWSTQLSSRLPLPPQLLATVLGTVAVGALVASAPPYVLGIPTLSAVIYQVAPFWRVYARFYIVAQTATVTLAALAWTALTARRRGTIWLVAVLAMVAFDFAAVRPSWSYTQQTPGVYRWLATVPGDPLIAEVPMGALGSPVDMVYRTFQSIHRKRMINDPPTGAPYAPAQAEMLDVNAPQTVSQMRALGVTYILVHRQGYLNPDDVTELHDSTLSVVYRSADVVAYRIEPGPAASAVLGIGQGFRPGEAYWPQTTWWTRGPGVLPIIPLRPDAGMVFHISLTVSSVRQPLPMVATQDRRTVWTGVVTNRTSVSFQTIDRSPIHLVPAPTSACVQTVDPNSSNTPCLSLGVANLSLTPSGDAP